MIEYFRSLLRAHQTLAQAASALATRLQLAPPAELDARVEALERSRALWEAEIDAGLVRADARFKAVRATEERNRHLLKKLGADEDDPSEPTTSSEIPTEWKEALRAYAGAGNADGVSPVHETVEAPRRATTADVKGRKWGRS